MGALSDKVIHSFLYVADKRPVLAFADHQDAVDFSKVVQSAEIYGNKDHVFLPTPHGLEFVRGGKKGETAYGKANSLLCMILAGAYLLTVFHTRTQAVDWFKKLGGYAVMYPDGLDADRAVFLGIEGGQEYYGEPIWPGVA
jgi:hypothetical protein